MRCPFFTRFDGEEQLQADKKKLKVRVPNGVANGDMTNGVEKAATS